MCASPFLTDINKFNGNLSTHSPLSIQVACFFLRNTFIDTLLVKFLEHRTILFQITCYLYEVSILIYLQRVYNMCLYLNKINNSALLRCKDLKILKVENLPLQSESRLIQVHYKYPSFFSFSSPWTITKDFSK